MIVILNEHSNDGNGLRKWEKFRKELERKYFMDKYTLVSNFKSFSERLDSELKKGERLFVAAGGDGTVNFLINQIMRLNENERKDLILGAIGLGSSNDFHKPFSETSSLNGKVPVKLDSEHSVQYNVGQVDFEDENGRLQRKYFIVNCSIGIIAQANYLFNKEDKVIRWLKSKWVMGTIYYAALKTILTAPNVPASIIVGKAGFKTDVTSLSIFISPHVSGNLSYDFNVSPQSDFFGIALCEKMGTLSRIKTFLSLAQGKFQRLAKTRSWLDDLIEICPDSLTPLELDGEVFLARSMKIKLLKGILKVSQ
jgi:diacylglycerol kinase family enzyme